MSDCEQTLRELDAFLDGELSEAVRGRVHEHLGGCTDCLSAFDFHAELKQVIQAKCHDDEMPAGLMARIEMCFQDVFDPAGDPPGDPTRTDELH